MMVRDPQQEQPVAYCAYCGGEIYTGDSTRETEKGCVHKECALEMMEDEHEREITEHQHGRHEPRRMAG